MEKLIYLVHWGDQAADTYLYGSRVCFEENGTVKFENDRMPSGTVIRRWYSQPDYQSRRLLMQLPVLEENRAYRIRQFVRSFPEKGTLLRFNFYNRQKQLISFCTLDEPDTVLVCPDGTYCYEMQLVQTGSRAVQFHHIEMEPMECGAEPSGEPEWFGQLWNPDVCSNCLNILLPELSGGMFRLPDRRRIWGISNFTMAPTDYVMTGDFFSDQWLQKPEWKRFQRKRFLACGRKAKEAALGLQYREEAELIVFPGMGSLYELELDDTVWEST